MKNNKIKIIAEIGWNHMGNISLAKKMIIQAKKSGADIVKFQTWSVSNLKTGSWDEDGRRDIYKKAELSEQDYLLLKKFSDKNKIEMTTSLFNIKDYNKIKSCKFRIIKIPSHEVHNLELIKFCIKKFKIVLISTGASRWAEILKISKLPGFKKKVTLLHCVSTYPANSNIINLNRLKNLSSLTKNVGYSGHYSGIEDAVFALNYGVSYVEKHFTIDNRLPGRDNKFALLPKAFAKLCNYRDIFLNMIINRGLNYQAVERDVLDNYRGRWSKK